VLPWREALQIAASDVSDPAARFCLWENATIPLGASLPALITMRAAMAFAIGPEGGLAESEVEDARVLGYAAVSLGPFVLRTETVAAAVLGAVRILTLA
jgi:RsmE family RNA methyltransferase